MSERSPDERSDIRVFASAEAPACRFTHAGYLLASSHRRHSGMRRKAQTRNPWRHNITWRNGFSDVQLHIKARSPGAKLMLASILSQASRPGMTNGEASPAMTQNPRNSPFMRRRRNTLPRYPGSPLPDRICAAPPVARRKASSKVTLRTCQRCVPSCRSICH